MELADLASEVPELKCGAFPKAELDTQDTGSEARDRALASLSHVLGSPASRKPGDGRLAPHDARKILDVLSAASRGSDREQLIVQDLKKGVNEHR
jgi:hypothetical protein